MLMKTESQALSDVRHLAVKTTIPGAPSARSSRSYYVVWLGQAGSATTELTLFATSRNDLQIAEFFEPIFANSIPIPEVYDR